MKNRSKINYSELIAAGKSELPVENSEAKWIKNENYDNNWTLEKRVYVPGKNWLYDKNEICIFGWIEEIMFGPNNGKFEAAIPSVPDEEDIFESDSLILGLFDSVENAMINILENNSPDLNGQYF